MMARVSVTLGLAVVGVIVAAPAALAQEEGGDASSVGDLVGNWSPVVWLLIPLALVLALVTAIVLGPIGEPDIESRRQGGVARALSKQRGDTDGPSPS